MKRSRNNGKKRQKRLIWTQSGPYVQIRFFKIGLRHFFVQFPAKKLRNRMAGSMRTFLRTERTDRQRDGGKFKGPKCWSKKKQRKKSRKQENQKTKKQPE